MIQITPYFYIQDYNSIKDYSHLPQIESGKIFVSTKDNMKYEVQYIGAGSTEDTSDGNLPPSPKL